MIVSPAIRQLSVLRRLPPVVASTSGWPPRRLCAPRRLWHDERLRAPGDREVRVGLLRSCRRCNRSAAVMAAVAARSRLSQSCAWTIS